jgi:polygalacturonase
VLNFRNLSAVVSSLVLIVKAQAAVNPALPEIPTKTFNITNYSAIGNGVATNTAAIQSALDAAAAAGGGTVVIPTGTFLSGPIQFKSRINLHLDAGALLRMLPLDKYPGGTASPENLISGANLQDIAITGAGAIDGQGSPWWPYARERGARRPIMVSFRSCDRVLIDHVTLSNSPMFHLAIRGQNITVRGVTIRANPSTDPVNPSHNSDACDVSGKNILIQDCDVSVGDDNFTCGGGTSDVLITNCTYGYGHGVSIGSPTSAGVSNFTVINCTFNNTEAGIRIKSDRDRGGYLHNLSYINLKMTNVNFPILIYAAYMATNREYRDLTGITPETAAKYPSQPVGSRTPIYRDIIFSNITATAASGRRAGLIWGLPEMNVTNVLLEKVNIKADKAFGIYNAQNVRLVDCKIETAEGINKIASTNAEINVSGR